MRRLASIAVLGVLGIAMPLHAGGTSSGSSGSSGSESSSSASSSSDTGASSGSSSETSSSDTGATSGTDTTGATSDTGSTDDTGTTSDTTDTAADTTGGTCSCATGDESIAIDMPADGAMVDAPFVVIVDVVPRCPCFDCSCPAEDFEYAQLFVDTIAWAGPCYASPCEWEVSATVGSHEFLATATYPSGTASTSITVFIASIDPGTTGDPTTDPMTTAPPGSDTSTSGYAGEAPPSGGCGCASDAKHVHGPSAPPELAGMVLLVLGARRRRS